MVRVSLSTYFRKEPNLPSSKNYKRNYKQERAKNGSSVKEKARNAARKRARYALEKAGRVKKGDGKDVHHKDNNPKNNKKSNLKVVSKKKNRSFPRNKKGGHR